MENKLFESILVEAAIETVYNDICSIEEILFKYSGSGKIKESIIDIQALKTSFSDHINSIKENIEIIKSGKLQDDAIEKSNKRLIYLAGKCYTNNQYYHAMYKNGDTDEELDNLWKQLLNTMIDFNEAVKSDSRIYDMDKALQIYNGLINN